MTTVPLRARVPERLADRAPTQPAGVVSLLAGHGDRTALLGRALPGGGLSYAALAGRVADAAARLGTQPRLALIEGAATVEGLVAYLGALEAGCPVLLAGPGNDALAAAYDPDLTWSRTDGFVEHRAEPALDLHPDLALLLPTSGTTGSPKLVRLSRRNLLANATQIADYLALGPEDVAPTVLPLHYCYGLSVLHSHLLVGATLLLTEDSVVDESFWAEASRYGVTSIAGVPHTFELLDRIGFADRELPSLRYLTQAGGRMAPETVRRYAALGRERGWELFVMYGQTEATARMAWLPPLLAESAPETIGIPVPGGSFTVEPLPERPLAGPDEPEYGELVYHGANVMLGYAERPADLALGRTVTALRTGDVGRQREDGLFEVVGRRSRFAKVFGLRVDLDQVERVLAREGLVVAAADGGNRLVLGVATGARPVGPEQVRARVLEAFGLPTSGVAVVTAPELPRLPNGKTDYRALVNEASRPEPTPAPTGVDPVALVGDLLGRPDATGQDTFVGLGGDSLSYVEVSLRLERALGALPADWPTRPLGSLRAGAPRRGRSVETSVLLRALAIVAIVATHANLTTLTGGAHVLLGVLGFNFGRFQATRPEGDRARSVLRSVARIAVPSALVIGTVALWTPGLGWRQALLVNGVLGPRSWAEPAWHYWFVEAAVALTLLGGLLVVLPGLARRAGGFGLPCALLAAGLLTRFDVVGPGAGDEIHRAHVVLWLFAAGWALAAATRHWQKLLVCAVLVASVPGFFGDPRREALVLAGLLVLAWLPSLRLPSAVARVVGVLAAASLWIYLLHWQAYPHFEHSVPWLATLLGLGIGVAGWWAWERAGDLLPRPHLPGRTTPASSRG